VVEYPREDPYHRQFSEAVRHRGGLVCYVQKEWGACGSPSTPL
jgi:hypothetical protein